MKHLLLSGVLVTFVVGLAGPASTQDGGSLVGVWKLQKFDRCVVGAACTAFYGENPTGYLVYTKSGLFMSQGYGTGRVVPKTPDPNDAERVELFKSMFAWGGQYKAEGNKVTTKIEFAWQEGWKGQSRVTTAKVEGKTLTVELAPFKSTIDGSMIFTKLILERIE